MVKGELTQIYLSKWGWAMWTLNRKLTIATLMAAGGFSANAAMAQTGTATSVIVNPIAISEVEQLSFGKFYVDGGAGIGYITVEPEGNLSECTVSSCLGSISPSEFTIIGEPGAQVQVSHAGVSTNPVTFTLTDGTNIITFGLILHTPNLSIGPSGTVNFNLGARLRIPASTPSGTYSGTYAFNVEYN